jgi:hypothetical protein
MVEPTNLNQPPSADRIKLASGNLLQPIEKLLLHINNGALHDGERLRYIEVALPYTNETTAQRNERKRWEAEAANERLRLEEERARREAQDIAQTATSGLNFDFGNLSNAKAIHRAQMKVMAAVGSGLLPLEAGHRLIAMLDALRRAAADTVTEEKLLDYEETRAAPVRAVRAVR